MKSRATPSFWKCFDALPHFVQMQARAAYRDFKRDPAHPGLKFKATKRRPDMWSVRVSLAYRALGLRDGETIVWFWIGSHGQYERIIAS